MIMMKLIKKIYKDFAHLPTTYACIDRSALDDSYRESVCVRQSYTVWERTFLSNIRFCNKKKT